MKEKLPILKPKELEKVLLKLDFYFIRQRGSHKVYQHSDGRWTTIPFHGGEDISRGLLRKILNDIEITREEFIDLL